MLRLFSIGFFFIIFAHSSVHAVDDNELSDQADRINYTIGHQIGTDFKRQKINLNEQAVRSGIVDGQSNAPPKLDQQEMQANLLELKKNITAKMKAEANARIEKRKNDEKQKRDAGTAFMLQNQKKPGIKTMPSGLQYKIITNGKGPKPKEDDYITFNYRAKTILGKEFDSSFKKGKPATYKANKVLPGFTEAIQMMRPGSKWELYLPPEQAYGRHGPYAHQTIIIETELLSIGK